jgi:putative PEP-CTERM system histidine kinase
MPACESVEAATGPLAAFLQLSGWVVDIDEYQRKRDRYPDVELPQWLVALPRAWLVIPLLSGTDLVGFVVLLTPRTRVELNWEVLDLLKAASRQAASYLQQIVASEALIEARKFDAFNRMSAFVVHDLKNLVSQLSLMLRNAERHSGNPDFQRDMLSTIEHVVGRMNRLMLQLRTGTTPVEKPRQVDLSAVTRKVCAAKALQRGAIALDLAPGVTIIGHEDRLDHVIGHLVQNALDATTQQGAVALRVYRDGRSGTLEVRDTGIGMTSEFIRDQLFKPFATTKATGMGIGVYESAQYIASLGGRINVESAPGKGTLVRVVLPAPEVQEDDVEPSDQARIEA